MKRISLFILSCCWVLSSFATVVDSTDHGFTSVNRATIQATPEEVYEQFVSHLGEWWSDAHTWSGKASNLMLEAKVGGCWCERIPVDGMTEHARLVFMKPGEMLRFEGELGPLQGMAVMGKLTITFRKAEEGTQLEWVYTVGGYVKGGLKPISVAVDGVMAEQLRGLKAFVEK